MLDRFIEQRASRRRQMSVEGSGFGRVVAQNGLDQPKIDTRFQQVGGIGMAQRVNGDVFVQSTTLPCFFKDALDAFPANMANFGFGTWRRKQPRNRAMSFPKTPQHVEDGRRQRHVTLPAALATNVE